MRCVFKSVCTNKNTTYLITSEKCLNCNIRYNCSITKSKSMLKIFIKIYDNMSTSLVSITGVYLTVLDFFMFITTSIIITLITTETSHTGEGYMGGIKCE